jgi:biotin carboxyl carrier protein
MTLSGMLSVKKFSESNYLNNHRENRMTKAEKLIEDLKGVSAGDRLQKDKDLIGDILKSKRIGNGAFMQTDNGAMSSLGAENDKPADQLPPESPEDKEKLKAKEEKPAEEDPEKDDDGKEAPEPTAAAAAVEEPTVAKRIIGNVASFYAAEGKEVEKVQQYIVAFDREKKDAALATLKKMDPDISIDPEGNPARAWIRTSLPVRHISRLDGVTDVIPSKGGKFKD